ncbi:hypothetical protein GCM10027072_25080 [Streptomyces bullii]
MLRALGRAPGAVEALFAGTRPGPGADARLDAAVTRLEDRLAGTSPAGARRPVEPMALTLQASLLVRPAPAALADAFCATRLGDDGDHAFGTPPDAATLGTVLGRALPDGDRRSSGHRAVRFAHRHLPIPLRCQCRGADSRSVGTRLGRTTC